MTRWFKWSHLVVVLVLVPLTFELTFISAMFWLLSRVDAARESGTRNLNLAFQSGRLLSVTVEEGSAVMARRLGQSKRHSTYKRQMEAALADLQEYATDDPADQKYVQQAVDAYTLFKKSLERSTTQAKSGDTAGSTTTRLGTMESVAQILSSSRLFLDEKLKGAAQREEEERRSRLIIESLIGVCGLFSLGSAASMGFLLNRLIVRKIALLSSNAEKLTLQKPLADPLTGADEFAQLDAAFRDMAQQLETAQRREKQIIEHARDLICSLNRNGIFQSANPAAQELLGFPEAELIGRSLFDLVAPDDLARVKMSWEEALRKGQTAFETQLLTRGRQAVGTSWSLSWSSLDASMFCVVHNVSARKHLERERQDLMAMISHDLRAPLTGVQIALDLVASEALGAVPDSERVKLNRARRHASTVVRQVSDLLDIEKLESRKMQLDIRAIPLSDILHGAAEAVGQQFSDAGVKLSVAPCDSKIFADGKEIDRVMRNLLTNSVQHAPRGTTVTVDTAVGDGIATVRISDYGPVLPQQQHPYVFERFHEAQSPLPPRIAEAGLSLSLCKAIIEAHQGLIGIASEDGKSVFWFTLRASARKASSADHIVREQQSEYPRQ